jgi:GNAT superfamily N-acetyltransferase
MRHGAGGGKRVSAATLHDVGASLRNMETAQVAAGQSALVMVRDGEKALDHALEARGYQVIDPVTLYAASTAELAQTPPLVTTFVTEFPVLQVLKDLWQEGGIGPARIAIMNRAKGPKCALLGRTDDSLAGAAFVAIDRNVAMLHGLEVRETFRRKRVGHYIMGAAATWAQDRGAKWLAVAVTQANVPANKLYASLGMSIVGHYHYRIKPDNG